MSPVSRSLMKLVNTSPGTSTMMAPAVAISTLTGAPSAAGPQAAPPSTKADAIVARKGLAPALPSRVRHAPPASPASPAAAASAQPPEKNSAKKNAPTKYPSRHSAAGYRRRPRSVSPHRRSSWAGSPGGPAHSRRDRSLNRSIPSMSTDAWPTRRITVRTRPSGQAALTITQLGMANTSPSRP